MLSLPQLPDSNSRRMRKLWEAEMELNKEEDEVMCAWSAINIAHMKLLNSTFLNVQMDWCPEDRDGFYRPARRGITPPRLFTPSSSSSGQRTKTPHHQLRSITPKPNDIDRTKNSSWSRHLSSCAIDHGRSGYPRKRRESSPPAFHRPTNSLICINIKDEVDQVFDAFASSCPGVPQDSYFLDSDSLPSSPLPPAPSSRGRPRHSRRSSNDYHSPCLTKSGGTGESRARGRGRTTSLCPIGLQFEAATTTEPISS